MKNSFGLGKIRELIQEDVDFYKLVVTMFLSAIIGPSSRLVLPLYFHSYGLPTAEIALLMSLSGFAGIFSGLIAGKLSDMVGRKPVIAFGLLGYAIPWIIILLVPFKILFYVAMIIEGFTLQTFFTGIYAFIADVFPPEKRGSALGVWQSLFAIGSTIGQIVSVGLIYNVFGSGLYFILMSLLHVAGGFVALLFVKESKTPQQKLATRLQSSDKQSTTFKRPGVHFSLTPSNRPLVIYLLSSILRSIGQTMITPIFPLYLSDLGISIAEISLIYTLASVVNMVAPAVFGKLSDKFGRKKLLIVGIIIAGIASVLFLWATTFPQVLMVRLLSILAAAFTTPIGLAFLTELLSSSEQGLGIGFYNSILRIDSTAMGVIGGILVQSYGFNWVFIIGFITSIISAITITFGVPEKTKMS